MPGSEYVIKYISDLTEATSGAKQVERVNADMAKTISSDFQQATRVIGTSLSKVSDTPIKLKGGEEAIKTVSQLGTVIQTSDGSFKEFTKTQTFVDGQLTKTTGSLKDVTGQFGRTNVETAKAQKNFLTLGENIGRLAQRALIVIPIWLALRGAIMGTFSVIRDGLKTIEEQDRAFQKARRNIEATTKNQSELNNQFARLKREALELSLASGKSIEEVTNAFQKFATVGFDAETSITGMKFATKLAVVEFGDVVNTADAFARTLRVLVGESTDTVTQQNEIAKALALTDQLWQNNAFVIEEFNHNLQNVASVAKIANLSIKDTIVLLATLSTGGLANRAGRLLRTTILKALENIDEISKKLKISFDPATETTFGFILKLVDALEQLSKTENIPIDLADTLGELFTVRSSELIATLTTLRKTLLSNAQVVPDIGKLDKAFDDVTKTTGVLVERFHNANREIGKAFITGVVGGEDFNDSLRKIVETLTDVRIQAMQAGISLNAMFAFTRGESTLEVLVKGASKIQGEIVSRFATISKEARQALEKGLSETKFNEILEDIKNLQADIVEYGVDFADENIGVLNSLNRIKAVLKSNLEIEKNKQQTVTETRKEQESITKKQSENIAQFVLDIELDRLKALGATNSQLLNATDLYKRQTDLEDQTLDKVKRKLEFEKAINEEKRLQNKLGSDSIKLFEIAQTEGVEVAKRIGDVLSRETDFSIFARQGGKDLEIFKREFEDRFKQQQAEQFFKGERVSGLPELQGGTRINIEEEAIRGIDISKAIRENLKAQKEFIKLETKDMQIIRPEKVEIIGLNSADFEIPGALTNQDINRQINIDNIARSFRPGILTEQNIQTQSSFIFKSDGINISINAKNAEDLEKQINQKFEIMKTNTKLEIKNSLVGKQTPTL